MNKTPQKELNNRLKRFKKVMDLSYPDWEMAVIFSKINLFYFTGTMQDGILIIGKEEAVFWVRRSYERAMDES
ncbi:MAG: aminopeptidase P family N-terminal domain-containing protein [Methanobacterium sp.]|nr:aminopeptidase P family N-terminal domain-containing protein [Methanobacterium sp.]